MPDGSKQIVAADENDLESDDASDGAACRTEARRSPPAAHVACDESIGGRVAGNATITAMNGASPEDRGERNMARAA